MNPDTDSSDNNRRILPRSEIDFNMLMTDTVWGTSNISKELKEKITKYYAVPNEDGKLTIKKEGLWGLLNFYTRDIRLANLDNREINYVRYYLDLAGDLLHVDMISSFMICLNRVASVLETSQSKKGFLRKRMNTFTSENMQGDYEPKKKTMFGKSGGGTE